MPLSKSDISKLRKAKAIDLVAGGVWYYRNENNVYNRVVSDLEGLDDGYRDFIKNCSKLGFMYLNRSKPNYSLHSGSHEEDRKRIEYYRDEYSKKD